jgi:hypothetical protein
VRYNCGIRIVMRVAPSSRHQRELKASARAILKRNAFEDLGLAAHIMNTTQTTPVEPGFRIQLPPEWAEGLRLNGQVDLTRTVEGILVRPCPQATWDEIFATKLTIQPAGPSDDPEITDVTWDDLLF